MKKILFLSFTYIFLTRSLYSGGVIYNENVSEYAPVDKIISSIPIVYLHENDKDFEYSIVKLVYQKEMKDFKSSAGNKTIKVENIIYSSGEGRFVVNNTSQKLFAYSTYLPMNKDELSGPANEALKSIKGISDIDLRMEPIDISKKVAIDKETKAKLDERDGFARVCYKQYINNIPIGLHKGELCFYIYPDMKIWTITSTLVKPVGSGEIKKAVAPKNIFDKILIALKRDSMGSDIEIGNTGMIYDIIDNILVRVYYTDVVYKGKVGTLSSARIFYPAFE